MSELVSILIPAFKAGPHIGQALESVGRQTHGHWQLVVVEDGSNDQTQELVRQFAATVEQNVCYHNNGTNQGVSATRNKAMALAKGEILAFLDADDWWEPGHLATGLETLRAGADLCYSGVLLHDEQAQAPGAPTLGPCDLATLRGDSPRNPQNPRNPQDFGSWKLPLLPLLGLFENNFIQSSSQMMLRRQVAESVGEFDSELRVSEDCDYWMRALIAGFSLQPTGSATCHYRKHAASAMAQTLTVCQQQSLFYQKYLQHPAFPRRLREALFARSLFHHARLVRRQNPALARRLFAQAWRTEPWQLKYALFAILAALTPCPDA